MSDLPDLCMVVQAILQWAGSCRQQPLYAGAAVKWKCCPSTTYRQQTERPNSNHDSESHSIVRSGWLSEKLASKVLKGGHQGPWRLMSVPSINANTVIQRTPTSGDGPRKYSSCLAQAAQGTVHTATTQVHRKQHRTTQLSATQDNTTQHNTTQPLSCKFASRRPVKRCRAAQAQCPWRLSALGRSCVGCLKAHIDGAIPFAAGIQGCY
jgi:hypothetical protein